MRKKLQIIVLTLFIVAILLGGCIQFADTTANSGSAIKVETSEQEPRPEPTASPKPVPPNTKSDDIKIANNLDQEEAELPLSLSPESTITETPISTESLKQSVPPTTFASNLIVHFLDVGQADSAIIQLPNGQTMLIDGGNSEDANTILKYMRAHNITTIDYLVATHPHADHIGGLPTIINNMNVGEIYMPHVSQTTQTFESLLDAIEKKGLGINTAKAGVSILSIPKLQIDVVAPVRDDYKDLNDWSAVVKLTYGNTAFLFAGDGETLSEGHITADISADVLKVSHHGSRTSTNQNFLNRVSPDYGVISVGAKNTYGHPHDEVLNRLNNAGVDVLRTDLQGTIVFTSDSNSISVNTELSQSQVSAPTPQTKPQQNTISSPNTSLSDDIVVYITNTGKKYHLEGCRYLAQSEIETTLSAAKARGLTACGTCRPPN